MLELQQWMEMHVNKHLIKLILQNVNDNFAPTRPTIYSRASCSVRLSCSVRMPARFQRQSKHSPWGKHDCGPLDRSICKAEQLAWLKSLICWISCCRSSPSQQSKQYRFSVYFLPCRNHSVSNIAQRLKSSWKQNFFFLAVQVFVKCKWNYWVS